ncbi:phosphoethanolamine transferase [Campylobacter sp. RM16192]|uniref:phosphoethanolamine transferase n=1 Tax=Campylobacter sp. RM16192 TaxID=1660080 RepID=UPI0014510FDD|nr:phosphoethanolamine--lipid A transferase [Campylobacter sp. RM16192]QCD52351.1 phosphoethanolamine transferase [Campylobacter sp. RM16192]
MNKFKISWFKFVILNTFIVFLCNFTLFRYIYSNLDVINNIFMTITLPIMCFCIWASILSILYLPYLTKIISIIIISVSSLSLYFMYFYGVIIDSDMINNLFETDTKEALSFINLKFIAWILFFVILPCLFIFIVRIDYGSFKRHLAVKFGFVFLCLAVAGIFLFLQTNTMIPFARNHNKIKSYHTPFYQIYSVRKYFVKKYIISKKKLELIATDAIKALNADTKLMVFVIGETARAANYSLGGYKGNETNFYLKNVENLTYFSNVYSCGTSTAISVPCMFSKSTRSEFSDTQYQENALDVLKRVGVDTIWLGNNTGGCKGVCDRLDKQGVKYFGGGFDADMLDDIKNSINETTKDRIIIVHLQGSHGPTYYQRYPKEFDKFKPTCDTNELGKCSPESIRNTYDNTLLYTDYFLNEIINIVKDKGIKDSTLWYVSDHGESLGEDGLYLHGMPYLVAPDYQKHVPMVLFSNNDLIFKSFNDKAYNNLSHDNVFSSLLGYFGVKTKDYKKDYDLFSD